MTLIEGLSGALGQRVTYQVLRHESPVFVTALNVIGLRAFSLDSGDESPGQGLTDPEPLRELVERTTAATR